MVKMVKKSCPSFQHPLGGLRKAPWSLLGGVSIVSPMFN